MEKPKFTDDDDKLDARGMSNEKMSLLLISFRPQDLEV
jgi:hypothetical protein